MNRFTRVGITMLTMVASAGLVAAQPKADAKAPAKTEAKAPAKAPVKVVDATPPAKAEMPVPKVPQEVTDMAKMVVGTWKCTGSSFGMDGTATPMTGTMKSKTDLDGFWLHDSFEAKMGKAKFKFESFSTYDAGSKKWRSVMVDNWGAQSIGTSDGMKDGKMDVNMDTMGGPMGPGMFRDHMDASDAKAGVKMMGEASMDKGKTWNKVYEQTCKK
jgi:hypothetical protein